MGWKHSNSTVYLDDTRLGLQLAFDPESGQISTDLNNMCELAGHEEIHIDDILELLVKAGRLTRITADLLIGGIVV